MTRGRPSHPRYRNACVLLLLVSLATCSNIDNFEITETSETTLAGATMFERLIGDLGFGDWLNKASAAVGSLMMPRQQRLIEG